MQASRNARVGWRLLAVLVVLAVVAGAAFAWGPDLWQAALARWGDVETVEPVPVDDHHGHDHGHAHGGEPTSDHEHDETTAIELSRQALDGLGYRPYAVELRNFQHQLSLPGVVIERPGHSQLRVSSPLGGIVSRIHVIRGEAIEPHTPLFDLRLTHEDLVTAQAEFLKLAEELDVVNQEIARLETLTDSVLPARRVVEQMYEQQKLAGMLRAQHQALLLHGLSEEQVAGIRSSHELLQSLTIEAPEPSDDHHEADHPLHVQSLDVQVGQQVLPGDALCVLADHCELYIEGTAFEQDVERLREAIRAQVDVSADLLLFDDSQHAADGLKLMYLSDQVELDSRALHFYLKLPNDIALDRNDGSHRFVQWRFTPGQRVQLQIPVEQWTNRIVVPLDAVVRDGPERYVYRQNGDHFHRVPVHVEFADQQWALIAGDQELHVGDTIAGRGAFQIHLALRNKSGGAIDPHAGHNH